MLEGHFILSSGLHSEKYIQCAQLLSKPKKAKFICESLAEKIRKNLKKIDLLLSPAVGGIVIGYEIGRILNIETIFAERVNEIFSLRRGFKINKGQKILILEDVITTGKSSLECSNLVTKAGGEIVGYACLIDRSAGTTNIDKKIISQVEIQIPTYSEENLPKHLKGIKAIKPGSRNL
ncbi:uncharacterized protein METZ01_LOCUS78427 [marine metagenome]|uniref:orotate phosphoribosyltransferase n=1 Tax=marine metagenome TaxID=408172 RepID=A0A381UFW7_9ZZZZ